MADIDSKANKHPVTRSSLESQLGRQLRYLENSAALFDSGDHDEANRLATTLRVLLHDTPKSTSLLRHLGIKETLRYLDTGLYRSRLDAAMNAWVAKTRGPEYFVAAVRPGEAGLVEIRQMGFGAGWFAPLREVRFHPDDPKAGAMLPPQRFGDWWNTPLVETGDWAGGAFRTFSRRNLVSIMANQDGGAHVDKEIDRDYAALCVDHLGVEMGFGSSSDEADANFAKARNKVAFASMRQISFEVIHTLRAFLAEEALAVI